MAASAKHAATSDLEERSSKRPKTESSGGFPKLGLNRSDCNLDFTIEQDGLTGSGLHGEGFAYCWSGARANVGVKGGRYCFGCKVIESQPVKMEDTAKDQRNLCRVGISRGDDDVGALGESVHSFGYGGTGKFSNNGSFLDYGGKFGVGDTIICAVDLENGKGKIAFSKNGRWLGVAREFIIGPKGFGLTGVSGGSDPERAVFPHVLLKNVKVRVLLSVDHGLVPVEGYKPWDAAISDLNAVEGPKPLEKSNCEVVMMVGLPGAGKTTWAEKWAKNHPEKRYMLLGTNLALDQMKVPGLLRKKNYGERFERLMDRATTIFNQLLVRATNCPRNYILDQTNVYRTARLRKMKTFKDYKKIAVVVFPPPDELKRRSVARAKEMGKEVPAEAVNEMLANYVVPKTKDMLNSVEPFDEVWFPEFQRDEAEKCLLEMQNALPPRPPKKAGSTPTSSTQGSFQNRKSKEGSHASGQGSYSNSYGIQGRNSREASYGSDSQKYQNRMSPDHNLRDVSPLTNRYSRESSAGHSFHGNYSSPQIQPYHHQSPLADLYSRESSVHSYQGNYSSPNVSGLPSIGALGHAMPDQLAGNYSGYPSRHSPTVPQSSLLPYARGAMADYGNTSASRPGYAPPSMPSQYPNYRY